MVDWLQWKLEFWKHLSVQILCVKSQHIRFHWSICNWEKALLEEVVKMWVTMRGFSYAIVSAWVEKVKAASVKSLQKSKGLRKKLITK